MTDGRTAMDRLTAAGHVTATGHRTTTNGVARRFRTAAPIVSLIMVVGAAAAQETGTGASRLDAAAWQEDLTTMTGLLVRLHPDAFHTTSPAAFDSATRALRDRIPELETSEIIVELARLVASIGDGHTRVNLGAGSPGVPTSLDAGFERLPVRLEWFSDGVFVRSASREWSALVDGRVEEIGDVSTARAIELVRPIVHHDNPMTQRLLLPRFLTTPAVLRATGVVATDGSIRIVVRDASGVLSEHRIAVSPEADPGEVSVESGWSGESISYRSPEGPYWFERLATGSAIYVQLNASREDPDEPMPEFVRRLEGEARRSGAERIILDLRANDGGDSELTRPLLTFLAGWERESDDHGLFVLIGRATFSAAVVLATELHRFSGAVMVGEPTGGRPNQYGEIETFTLPNSGLTVSHSSWYFQTADPWDGRPWVAPDWAVTPSFEDFAAGADPALDAALVYDFRAPALGRILVESYREGGTAAALDAYRAFKRSPERAYADTEEALTELLVDHWRRDQVAESLPVARLIAEEYPLSFEAHENVAEVLAALGETAEAVPHAIESLRIHPGNGDALGVLREICGEEIVSTFFESDSRTEPGRAELRTVCARATMDAGSAAGSVAPPDPGIDDSTDPGLDTGSYYRARGAGAHALAEILEAEDPLGFLELSRYDPSARPVEDGSIEIA